MTWLGAESAALSLLNSEGTDVYFGGSLGVICLKWRLWRWWVPKIRRRHMSIGPCQCWWIISKVRQPQKALSSRNHLSTAVPFVRISDSWQCFVLRPLAKSEVVIVIPKYTSFILTYLDLAFSVAARTHMPVVLFPITSSPERLHVRGLSMYATCNPLRIS